MNTTGETGSVSQVLIMVSFWWSRRDDLANYQLEQILNRAGGLGGAITDPDAVDQALRVAAEDPAVVAELDQWWRMVSVRRGENTTRNPRASLVSSVRFLTDTLDADPLTAEVVGRLRQQVSMIDDHIVKAKNLPEMVDPDAELLELIGDYLAVRSRVLALPCPVR